MFSICVNYAYYYANNCSYTSYMFKYEIKCNILYVYEIMQKLFLIYVI